LLLAVLVAAQTMAAAVEPGAIYLAQLHLYLA